MTITDRIDNITLIDEAHLGTNIPAPRSVKIELSGRCNFACTYCARSMRLREQRDMDFNTFTRIATDMRESGVEELGLFYLGESFLYPRLVDAIDFAKNKLNYPYVFLTTNGSIAYADKVRECMNAGLDSLKFSLNYADEKQFSDITQVNSKLWWRVLDNIRGAKDARDLVLETSGHKCGLYISYIAYDNDQKQKMDTILQEMKPYVDEVYALPLYNQASFVSTVQEALGYTPVAGNLGRLDNLRDSLPCWACFTEGHVTWDGKLSACCFDHDGRFHMGDLNTNSFMECWNSDKFIELRTAHLNKCVDGTVCEQCVIWK